MNLPFIKTEKAGAITVFPSFKIQSSDGNIFIVPQQLKTPVFIYFGHSNEDFSTVYMYLRKSFDTKDLAIMQIIKTKPDKNVGLNNQFFTASKMELHRIENFVSNNDNNCYYLLDTNGNIIWYNKNPINTVKKLTSIRSILH